MPKNKKLNCILLVDDDPDSNFFNKRLIEKINITERVEISKDGEEAIDFLTLSVNGKYPQPSIIFLDINMPKIDGWEFLERYDKLPGGQKAQVVIIMLSIPLNLDDKRKAEADPNVTDYISKYFDEDSLESVLRKYFS